MEALGAGRSGPTPATPKNTLDLVAADGRLVVREAVLSYRV